MRTLGWLQGLSLILLLVPFPLHAQNRILGTIPIELERNKTTVPVTVGTSGPLRLILDSGMDYDGVLLFHLESVDRSQFRDLREVRIGGAGQGPGSGALSDSAAAFSVGPMEFVNQRVTILTSDIYRGFPTDGVLGYSLLGHYAVEIDYDEGRMTLYEPSTFAPEPGWESLDLYFRDNRVPWMDIAVATAGEDPVRISTYIDFASGAALELLRRETNVFTLPEQTERKFLGRGLSGDIYGEEGRVSKVVLGPFTLENVNVALAPAEVRSRQEGADGIVGNDALRRFNVIFDYAHLKIHLRPNRYFSEPFR